MLLLFFLFFFVQLLDAGGINQEVDITHWVAPGGRDSGRRNLVTARRQKADCLIV